jgi:hypothetical protein
MKKALVVLATGLFLVAMASQSFAQDQPGGQAGGRRGNRGQGGAGGPGGGFDPAAMVKQALGVTDDEWKVIEPKVTKVQTLQRDARSGGRGFGGMMGGRGGRGGGAGGAAAAEPTTDVAKATAALAKVLENKDAPAADIKTALQALREARVKADAAIEAAQKDLKEILTARQEAILVQMGTLK